eukprot:131561-Chlamydomonas_euryale.AAC.4
MAYGALPYVLQRVDSMGELRLRAELGSRARPAVDGVDCCSPRQVSYTPTQFASPSLVSVLGTPYIMQNLFCTLTAPHTPPAHPCQMRPACRAWRGV